MAARRQASPPSAAEVGPVRIDRIGADGDGIGRLPDGRALFLAGTLPGELVQPVDLVRRGSGIAGSAMILEASPDRATPPCPHFGTCGGCTLQHWTDQAYAAWKLARVAVTTPAPLKLARTQVGERRRMDLAIQRTREGIIIGLHRRRSSEIVDMRTCHVLHPDLLSLVQALRPVLAMLDGLDRRGEAKVNLLDSGIDLALRTDRPLSASDRLALAALANAYDVPRVSWLGPSGPEPAAQLRSATTNFAGRRTAVPPAAFLQASRAGERAIVEAVMASLPAKLGHGILELFSGCGTLTHALSDRSRVTAFEGDAASVAALRATGNSRITAVRRDLVRQPLSTSEARRFSVIVLDPPYAGAGTQLPALAETGLPIIYVSCNPIVLMRDQSVLADRGYHAEVIAVIDQFLWSTQVEAVIRFSR